MIVLQKFVLIFKCVICDENELQFEECLYKVLVNVGFGLCCMLEQCIQVGEVEFNGFFVGIGVSVYVGDCVVFDGKQFVVVIDNCDEIEVFIYYKFEGVMSMCDDFEGCFIVFEQLLCLKGVCWVVVGCLDINIIGLLLFIIDGELVNVLMYFKSVLECEYLCCVYGEVFDEIIEKFKVGVELEDGFVCFDEIVIISCGGSYSWFCVVICEG